MLVASMIEMEAALTDAALVMVEKMVGALFRRADRTRSDRLLGQAPGPGAPWATVDWDADPDWEWRTAAGDTPDQLMTLWQDAVIRSRSAVGEVLADGGLDQLVTRITNDRGESPSLRRTLIDIIEEYARHVGHADLIRESVDGLVGEDPPG